MKKRINFFLVLVLSLVLMLSGCGSSPSSDSNAGDSNQSKEKIVIQFGSGQASTSVAVQGLNRMKELVENEIGKDRVEIKIFPDGQLGADIPYLEGMKLGTHEGLVVGSPLTNVDSKFFIFDLPYLFNDRADVEKITKGEVGKKLDASLLEKGYVNLGYWYTGWRVISNNQRPIVTPDDLEGLKIRISTSPSRSALIKHLGAAPAPLPAGETFSAMQQGVVDGQENPVYVMTSNAYMDVQKYVSKTNHLVLMYEVLLPKDKWDSLPEDIQQSLIKAAQTVADETWDMTDEIEEKVYAAMEGKVEVNECDIDAFQKKTESIYSDPYFVDAIGQELLDEALATLGR